MESIDEESPLKKKTSTNVVAEEKRSRRKSDRVDSVIKINYSRESQRDPPKIKDESKLKKDTSPKAKDVTTPKAMDVILKTHDSRESQRDLSKEKKDTSPAAKDIVIKAVDSKESQRNRPQDTSPADKDAVVKTIDSKESQRNRPKIKEEPEKDSAHAARDVSFTKASQ